MIRFLNRFSTKRVKQFITYISRLPPLFNGNIRYKLSPGTLSQNKLYVIYHPTYHPTESARNPPRDQTSRDRIWRICSHYAIFRIARADRVRERYSLFYLGNGKGVAYFSKCMTRIRILYCLMKRQPVKTTCKELRKYSQGMLLSVT